MKKFLTLLALALLVALPGCHRDKKNKAHKGDDRRVKTTKQDSKGKKAPAKKTAPKKGVAKKAPARTTMVDADCE